MKTGATRFFKYGGSFVIRIPREIKNDKQFPFKVGEELLIRIEGHKMTVERE